MKILMRAAKNPFHAYSAVETLRQDTIGQNSGNLLFAAGAHSLLSTKDSEVSTVPSLNGAEAGRKASEDFDAVVLPFANCFRSGFEKELIKTTEFIESLDIPFAMLSGGAQVEYGDDSFQSLSRIEGTVKRFCRAVLDKSDKITVRGEQTAKYIRSLGFNEVQVIGCPSLTRPGPDHTVNTAASQYGNAVAYNIETRKDMMGDVISRLSYSGAKMTHIAQDSATLEMLVWTREMFDEGRDPKQPVYLDHPDIAQGRTRFFLDSSTWIDFMRHQNCAFGPRIHGAISAISAGIPALLVAHDLRTRELADYHGIPHVLPRQLEDISEVNDLWERMDYRRFNSLRGDQVRRVVDHLEVNGLQTTLSEGKASDRVDYFRRLSLSEFPNEVVSGQVSSKDDLVGELRRKSVQMGRQMQSMQRRITRLESSSPPKM